MYVPTTPKEDEPGTGPNPRLHLLPRASMRDTNGKYICLLPGCVLPHSRAFAKGGASRGAPIQTPRSPSACELPCPPVPARYSLLSVRRSGAAYVACIPSPIQAPVGIHDSTLGAWCHNAGLITVSKLLVIQGPQSTHDILRWHTSF
jgi:hypothetical protein